MRVIKTNVETNARTTASENLVVDTSGSIKRVNKAIPVTRIYRVRTKYHLLRRRRRCHSCRSELCRAASICFPKTAMTAVENLVNDVTTRENIWSVNTEMDYHEER